MIKLLIYDLDGTLIDSRRDIANAVNWALKELGLQKLSIEEISSFVGRGVTNLMRGVLGAASRKSDVVAGGGTVEPLLERSIKLYRTRYAEHLLDETQLFPSVRPVLEHFKNRRQAVITNKPEVFSLEILRGLHVDSYFFRVIGGDEGFQKKPSPEPVLEIVNSARVQPSEAALIGDSAVDIETGKNAKVMTVAVTYGFGTREEIKNAQPDVIVEDLRDLIRCPNLV